MILYVNFEEIQALDAGAELVRVAGSQGAEGGVAAPPAGIAETEALRTRLTGDLSIATLADQQRVRHAVGAICDHLRERLESKVIEFNPGHEEAVDLYFDYAHAVTVLDRLDRMGAEMRAMIEVMGIGDASRDAEERIPFPD